MPLQFLPYREQYPQEGRRLSHAFLRDRQVLQTCGARDGGRGGEAVSTDSEVVAEVEPGVVTGGVIGCVVVDVTIIANR